MSEQTLEVSGSVQRTVCMEFSWVQKNLFMQFVKRRTALVLLHSSEKGDAVGSVCLWWEEDPLVYHPISTDQTPEHGKDTMSFLTHAQL